MHRHRVHWCYGTCHHHRLVSFSIVAPSHRLLSSFLTGYEPKASGVYFIQRTTTRMMSDLFFIRFDEALKRPRRFVLRSSRDSALNSLRSSFLTGFASSAILGCCCQDSSFSKSAFDAIVRQLHRSFEQDLDRTLKIQESIKLVAHWRSLEDHGSHRPEARESFLSVTSVARSFDLAAWIEILHHLFSLRLPQAGSTSKSSPACCNPRRRCIINGRVKSRASTDCRSCRATNCWRVLHQLFRSRRANNCWRNTSIIWISCNKRVFGTAVESQNELWSCFYFSFLRPR